VFTVDTAGHLTVLYNFTGGADGATQKVIRHHLRQRRRFRGVVYKLDSTGVETVLHPASNLYGTAFGAGTRGNGVVYKVDTAGTLTVLYPFGGSDVANPRGGARFTRYGIPTDAVRRRSDPPGGLSHGLPRPLEASSNGPCARLTRPLRQC
jgi:uncharacterized repeat protein (TIGR03803 family)